MLCAQVFRRAVTECLSGSCSSLEVMYLYTDCKKGLAAYCLGFLIHRGL